MRFTRLAGSALGAAAVALTLSCSDSSTGNSGITCGDAPICPSASLTAGFNGAAGTPTIAPANPNLNISTATSAFPAAGATSSASNGYWLLVQNGVVRAWGVITVSTGVFAADIPLFCGGQSLYYGFTNGSGTSYFLTNVTLTGCVPAQVRVQLTWVSSPTSDLDLHLLRPSGTFDSSDDCYYSNCQGGGLDWGATGSAGDPVLDVDDTEGYGPENITIASGAESGEYRVIIHDYDGTVGEVATVRIYFNDVEAAHYTSVAMDDSGHRYWEVARVNVLTHAITAVNTYGSSAPTTAGVVPAAPRVK
jgi:uncharacterized protein YfaP (DUF2135 family)